MTSLSDQLKAIGLKTASVALDRKSRTKMHSRSLIYDAKTAAAQDYDYIYLVCLDGFEHLCQLDSRFTKFGATLFSETAVQTDRNVQPQDVVDALSRNIDAFLELVGPYWRLQPAVFATEWLVRRFYANIHNAEQLLTSCLPYHADKVFVKCLYVIPKAQMPLLFTWANGYKDLLQPPPMTSVVKAFMSRDFFRYYTAHLVSSIQRGTAHKDQLVLYLAAAVQVVASHGRDPQKLSAGEDREVLVSLLECVGHLLVARHDRQLSSGMLHDCRLTAYSLVAVLAQVVSLLQEVIDLLMVSIADTACFPADSSEDASALSHQSLIVMGQLWDGSVAPKLPPAVYRNVLLGRVAGLLHHLQQEGYRIDRLAVLLVTGGDEVNAAKLKVASLVPSTTRVTEWLVAASQTALDDKVRRLVVEQLEAHLQQDKVAFELVVRQAGLTISGLEMSLMSTLRGADVEVDDSVQDDAEDEIIDEAAEEALASQPVTVASGCLLFDNADFSGHLQALLRVLAPLDAPLRHAAVSRFSQTAFADVEAAVSFYIRVGFTPAAPIGVRVAALRFVRRRVRELGSAYHFHLLVPVLLLGLHSPDQRIRLAFADILKLIKPGDKKAPLFLELIYGGSPRDIVSPADSVRLLDALALDDVVFDRLQLPHALSTVFAVKVGNKRFGSLFRAFVHHQWSLPFSLALKYICWALGAHDSQLSKFVENRPSLEAEAAAIKVPFEDVEAAAVNAAASAADTTAVEWLLTAAGSPFNSLQILADTKLSQIFGLLTAAFQLKVATRYLELLADDSALAFDPMSTLQRLPINHELAVALLRHVQLSPQAPGPGLAKRRRRLLALTRQAMARDDVNALAATHLQHLTSVLDLLEYTFQKTVLAEPDLLEALFAALTDLDYLGDGQLPVLYAQETLAHCMLLAIAQMKQHGAPPVASVRADLVVNAIRTSQSPQVQNRLLLVVAELAAWAPQTILHLVMPIFTFMGAHTVRQDDAFLSSVLQQTVAKVIPAIADSAQASDVEFLLASFAAAFPHIPRHRRVQLFASLARTLGAERLLHVVIFLMGQQYATAQPVAQRAIVDFASALLRGFSASEQLSSINGLLELWQFLPDQPVEAGTDAYADLSGRAVYGSAVLALLKQGLVNLKTLVLKFVEVVVGDDLKMKIATSDERNKASGAEPSAVLAPFRQLVAFILTSLEKYTSDGVSSVTSTKLLPALYALLSKLMELLPLAHFIDSILTPLAESRTLPMTARVARNLCVLASAKIETEVNTNNVEGVLSALMERLSPALVREIAAEDAHGSAELQLAFITTYAAVVTKLGACGQLNSPEHSKGVANLLHILTGDHALRSSHPEVVVASIHAIASIVNILGVKAIGFFNKIVPPTLEIWKETREGESAELIQAAVLGLLACFVRKLPAFMTSSLESTLVAVLTSDLVDVEVRSNVLAVFVQQMEGPQLIRALCRVWLSLSPLTGNVFCISASVGDLGLFVNTMQRTIDAMDKRSATAQATVFIKWLIAAFEFRDAVTFDTNTVRRLEALFHACGISYVMKLNDKVFRPLFAQLVRWATTGEGAAQSPLTADARIGRLTAFFRFFNKLQDQLKSIITTYYTYIIDPVAQLLRDFESKTIVDINLRRIVLNSLTSAFKYDQDDFWLALARFDTILDPLVLQLHNIEDAIGKYVVKAVTAFVVCVALDEYNERLVHALIACIGGESGGQKSEVGSQCKIWTVRVLKSIFQKMGDQWLGYLPTLIPYIAELLEDDDEAVELEVRKGLVRVIENVLGEPLDRYLD